MTNDAKQLETFIIWSDEIEARLDPFFYRPVFKNLSLPSMTQNTKPYH